MRRLRAICAAGLFCAGLVTFSFIARAAPIAATPSDGFVDSIGINIHATHYLGFPSTSYDDWPSVINAVGNLGIRNVRDHVFDPARLNQLTAATGAKDRAIIEEHQVQ